MAYKFLQTSFQYLYKFEINSKINEYGSIKVYNNSGNLLYSDVIFSRGHTLYIFNKSLELISKTYYNSYGEMNTNGITDKINKYLNGNSNYYGYMFAIVTYDAITHDSTFNNLMWSKSDLNNSFHLGKDITCIRARNSFAFLGTVCDSNTTARECEYDCDFDYNIGENSTLTSYIIKKSKSSKPIVLTRNLKMYTRIYPYNDSTQPIGVPYVTHNTGTSNKSIELNNPTLYAGRTYYVRVKFRTRGDGTSSSSKCSSVGFITYWNNWANTRSYIHNSATAYNEIGKIVQWTYSFTVDEDVTPSSTRLYFIINNGWANGNDGQTIDLYYAKYWDSEGNVYNEFGKDMIFLKLKKDNIIYYTPSAERYKHLNGNASEPEGKIFFADSNSKNNTLYSIYPLRDTLEKYTYNELEHLCFHFPFHHYMNLKYMELYNY